MSHRPSMSIIPLTPSTRPSPFAPRPSTRSPLPSSIPSLAYPIRVPSPLSPLLSVSHPRSLHPTSICLFSPSLFTLSSTPPCPLSIHPSPLSSLPFAHLPLTFLLSLSTLPSPFCPFCCPSAVRPNSLFSVQQRVRPTSRHHDLVQQWTGQ